MNASVASQSSAQMTAFEDPFAGPREMEDRQGLDWFEHDFESPFSEALAQEMQVSSASTVSTAHGRVVADQHPLLRAHRGTPPDLVIRWNRISAPGEVDVVVHFHGFSGKRASMQLPRDKEPISGLDFVDPASPATVGRTRPTIALLPRGHYYGGRSGNGYSFPELVKPGVLDQLIDDALARFTQETGIAVRRGRLILTGHSGGGAPLMMLLRHMDPDEIHVFDGLYGSGAALIRWARARIAREVSRPSPTPPAMRVLYIPGTGTEGNSVAVGRAVCRVLSTAPRLNPYFRVDGTRVGHNAIPKRFGWALLADPAAEFRGVVRRVCAPRATREAYESSGQEAEDMAIETESWVGWEAPPSGEAFEAEGYDPEAYVPGAYPAEAYASEGYVPGAYPAEAYASEGYVPGAYPAEAYASEGYVPGAYPAEAYASEGYVPGAYPAEAYASEGYVPGAYPAEAYASEGYEPQGYEPEGYEPEGYEPQGYEPQGYEPEGYEPQGYEPEAHALDAEDMDVEAFEADAAEAAERPQFEGEGFPSGVSLTSTVGPTGPGEEHYDPNSAGLPLYSTGPTVRNLRLSRNFTVGELVRSGAQYAAMARISPALVQVLQAIRERAGRPVQITSGYRSWARNRALYRARGKQPTRSRHCSGQAADIKVAGLSGLQLAKLALDAGGPNLAIGIGNTYIHVDVRGQATTWTYLSGPASAAATRELDGYRATVRAGGPTPIAPVPQPEPRPGPQPGATPAQSAGSDRAAGVVRQQQGAPQCAGRTQPGARALANQWTRLTGRRAGTYNCRPIRGGQSPSVHGDGRAIDAYCNANDPIQRAQGDAYAAWLIANAIELQCPYVIWNGRQWSWPRRTQGWRPYRGQSPHTDHLHIELSWEGARQPSSLFNGGVPGL